MSRTSEQISAPTAVPPATPVTPIEIELRPLAPLPGADSRRVGRRRHKAGFVVFAASVVLPLALGALYLFAVAAPRYASEASYIVRSTSTSSSGGGVSSLMQTRGVSRAVDETYAINEYLTSPDVVNKLVSQNNLRDILGRPEADRFNRYPSAFGRDNQDALRRRFQSMLTETVDEGTGISQIEIVAFRPEDAQAIATALIKYAEEMVNRLNQRAYKDALATANTFVDQAMENMRDAESALTAYRDTSGSVDPSSDAASTMRVIQTLTIQLSRLEASISEQEAMTPQSPQSEGLRQRVVSLRQEIDQLKLKVAGSDASAANKLGKYEELALRRTLAAKSLDSAVQTRDKAREESANQHLYVQVIRTPSLPDVARYPRSFLDFGVLIAISLMIYLVLRGFAGAAQEHRV